MLRAANLNHPGALYQVALSYLRFPSAAQLIPEDPTLGFVAMERVATSAKDNPEAYFYLSQLYRQGKGTEKNLPRALQMVRDLVELSTDEEEKKYLEETLREMAGEL